MGISHFGTVLADALECAVTASRTGAAELAVDEWLQLDMGAQAWRLALDARSSAGPDPRVHRERQDLIRGQLPDAVPLLAVPRTSKRERAALRQRGVNHMDLAGNVWIRGPGLVVKTEGARRSVPSRPGRGRNPYSKKASLVARVLLADPARAWRVRDLADEASLSVGYSSEVLQSLVERGHAAERADGFRLADPVALLAEWASVYRWEDNRTYSFVVPFAGRDVTTGLGAALHGVGTECWFTLLVALDHFVHGYVEHEQTHAYVPEVSHAVREAVRSRLHAEPVARGGNLHLMEPYYGSSVQYGMVDDHGFRSVSDVQLFLDLIHYPLRGPEAADVLLRKRLGPRLGLTVEQQRALRDEVGL